MSSVLKIIISGPCGAGKTEMANAIAHKEGKGNTEPTIGLRILEFPKTVEVNQMQQEINVQLWDMSGDDKFSITWPAIEHDADGLILLYNSIDKKQASSLEKYATKLGANLVAKQVLVVAHKFEEDAEKVSHPKLPKNFKEAKIVIANARDDIERFSEVFDAFSSQLFEMKLKKIEDKEKQLVGEPVEEAHEEAAAPEQE